MLRDKILYQAKQEIFGKHLRAKEWIKYSGKLIVYERDSNSVILIIKSEIADTFLAEIMDDEKEFKGNSVTEVYAKLSKWLNQREIIFQN
jgi:predicted RNA-binding protein